MAVSSNSNINDRCCSVLTNQEEYDTFSLTTICSAEKAALATTGNSVRDSINHLSNFTSTHNIKPIHGIAVNGFHPDMFPSNSLRNECYQGMSDPFQRHEMHDSNSKVLEEAREERISFMINEYQQHINDQPIHDGSSLFQCPVSNSDRDSCSGSYGTTAASEEDESDFEDDTSIHCEQDGQYCRDVGICEQINQQIRFRNDFEQTFTNSNIPQIIATCGGKITAWNNIFASNIVPGLSSEVCKNLTIFNLVRADNISHLYDVLYRALHSNVKNCKNECLKGKSNEQVTNGCIGVQYEGVTLPSCIYPSSNAVSPWLASLPSKALNMTAILLDDDEKNRCIRCIFTEYKTIYTDNVGDWGAIKPDLISCIF